MTKQMMQPVWTAVASLIDSKQVLMEDQRSRA